MNVHGGFAGGKRFIMKVRGHDIVTDLPDLKGGEDAGPTPSELFIASLGGMHRPIRRELPENGQARSGRTEDKPGLGV
jgi:hypothetical protein